MGFFKKFLRQFATGGRKASLATASADQAVECLLPEDAYLSPGFDKNVLAVSDAARSRLRGFPREVQRDALLRGLEHKDAHVRAACVVMLLHWQDPKVLRAMERHLNDSDTGIAGYAKLHVDTYGSA